MDTDPNRQALVTRGRIIMCHESSFLNCGMLDHPRAKNIVWFTAAKEDTIV